MHDDPYLETVESKRYRDINDIMFSNIKDQEAIEDRIIKNEHMIDVVVSCLESHHGGKLTVDQLRIYARSVSKIINKKIDRLANRNRMALLCWYSENWNEIYPHLNEFIPSNPENQNSSDHEQNFETDREVDPSDLHQLLNYH
ncbi:hypothetical protein TVAG_291630 [Trichomonas vaginalis G3]|uniref:Uncharacterized protein n=1 Tax=Trichomonas vaginalis (strain ATCC PRA-98 / G3) TaxID=412133 RepID=A2DQU4_TRIV3|nr:hypothetical protein TVAGG3_0936980 [Trichomonas vaginalis G3]EAY17211.1 hypothetical protein TVAG_291630 [Trichomonas vaginalis G3]KAI5486255.1 hypothetical protein TVAGG3_0936980 [Trichomonas vaginalis G3]|eukprot:XP_001329434.1 hypothetical protein [Trichomonas vaginalis G3]